MNYKCETCHDTADKDKSGGYLNCPDCDAPHQRASLNKWLMKQPPLSAFDAAWAIHQRALAMAPKQEAPTQEPVAYLRFRAAQQWSGMGGHDIEHCEWLETCHAHEVGDDKLPAFPVYAAPAAANGAMPELPVLPKADVEGGYYDAESGFTKKAMQEYALAYGRAILAAAGPDAALAEDAERYRFLRDVDPDAEDPAIMMHVQNDWGNWSYMPLSGDDADQAIDAALCGAKGN